MAQTGVGASYNNPLKKFKYGSNGGRFSGRKTTTD